MQAPQLPTPIRCTYASLRVFAWAGFETPDLSWDQVTQAAGKDRKTVYRHLLTLAKTGVTRWRTAGAGHLRLTFTDGIGGAENRLNFETPANGRLKNETSQKRDGRPDTLVLPGESASRLKNETSQKRDATLSLTTPESNPQGLPKKQEEERRLKNETSQKRDEQAASLFALAQALADVCRMDLQVNRGRLFREAKALSVADPPPTPDLIQQHYGTAEAYWQLHDWRGQRGEFPTPATLRETWGRWKHAQEKTNGPKRNDAPGRGPDEPISEAQRIARRLSGGGAVGGDHGGQGPRG
jgi:hypothetical protein